MSSIVTLKAVGLNTSPNQLDLPEGSLIEAKNIIIKRENTIEQIRGFKVFGDAMGASNDRAKTLFEYREKLFRHYGNTLDFQLDGGKFQSFITPVVETQDGLRIKKVESNGNLYFTTSEGIKKVSALSGEGLRNAEITAAGGIKAVDFTAKLNVKDGDQSGFLPQDSAVAYRVVWGTKDANNNLILGAPSQREEVYNPLDSLILRDYHSTLRALDGVSNLIPSSLISDGDYVSVLKLPTTATSVEIQTGLVSLAEKIDKDIVFAQETVTDAPLKIDPTLSGTITTGNYIITFSSGNPEDYLSIGSLINLTGFAPDSGTLDGIHTVVETTPTTITIATDASGSVTLSGNAQIESGKYRNIPQPAVPSIPSSNQELVALQEYLGTIILSLQTENSFVISSGAQTEWVSPLDLTKTATVNITITIPEGITPDHFYQLYRSSIAVATDAASLQDIFPSDELQLVYEAYPTAQELLGGEVSFEDVTPDEFRGANLYTNPSTGEGILQSNDVPPFAKDINRFKNVVFYANTKTRHRTSLSLLGVQKMINDFDDGVTPTLTIISGDQKSVYTFVKGVEEVSEIDIVDVASLPDSGESAYFVLYSANDETKYIIYFKKDLSQEPSEDGIKVAVEVSPGDDEAALASKTSAAIASYPWDFASEADSDTVIVSCTKYGKTTDIADGSVGTGFTFAVTQDGVGEDASTNTVLLSNRDSVALAVDETARSLIRVINKDPNGLVYAYYLSGNNDVPGKMLLESKSLNSPTFYVVGNNAGTGESFNPDISGDFQISSIGLGVDPTITTATPHFLKNKGIVVLSNTNSTPSIDGAYPIYEVTPTSFKIDLSFEVTVAGTEGVGISGTNSVFSENEEKRNRIYYSKISQPEAVPLVNYLDVGDADKEILRIFPLRDSLFVFKEEGLYRISGETAPFTLALFDSSCQLTGPDTVDVNNNQIYLLTTQGVMTVSEGGINIISQPIDNIILRIPVFPNYKKLSFGVGYESDNSYTLWTVQRQSDQSASIGFRYSNLTNSWTTVDRVLTCGFVNPADDRSYHGAGDINFIEQERKDFDRFDYAEREYNYDLLPGSYSGNLIRLSDVNNVRVGDVLVQDQTLTVFEFNALLKKLDFDAGIVESDYFETLAVSSGDDLRQQLLALARKLDADPSTQESYESKILLSTGTISSISTDYPAIVQTVDPHGLLSGRNVSIAATDSQPPADGDYLVTVTGANTFTIDANLDSAATGGVFATATNSFADLKGCFNIIIDTLNMDNGVGMSNYRKIDNNTIQEAIVVSVNKLTKEIELNIAPEFIVGTIVVFRSIDSAFTYAPNVFGNPISLKRFREVQVLFENKAFTRAAVEFHTDLLPEFKKQEFVGHGNGIFGHVDGFGDGFFGGASNGTPFRTYIPRDCHRGRYIVIRFSHNVAREQYRLYGMTLTGQDTASTRAYR